MSSFLAQRAGKIKTSATIEIFSKAKNLMAAGHNVINFGVGEPDFNTPDYVKNAAIQAIQDNFTRYTVVPGIPPLRQAIADKLKKDNGLNYSPDEIIVTNGAKSALMHVIMAVVDPSDDVLVPEPYWVSYTSEIQLVGGNPVTVPMGKPGDFSLSAENLEKAIGECKKPKAIILNSPNNPSGMVYSRENLEEIARICVKHNIFIISDEIYEKLVYDDNQHISIASISPEAKAITAVINGVSKAYAMTGWRLGYCAGSVEVIKAMNKIQGHTNSNVNSITQKAAIEALTVDDGSIEKMRQAFEERRDFMYSALSSIDHVKCEKPRGAFYAFPDISYFLTLSDEIKTDADLCMYMLEKQLIAIVPGSGFGVDGHVRFSYANSMENLKEGVQRFKEGLEKLLK